MIDSLKLKLATTSNDSIRVEELFRIGYNTYNIDSQWVYYDKALKLSRKIKFRHIEECVYESLQSRMNVTPSDSNRVKLLFNMARSTNDFSVPHRLDTLLFVRPLREGIDLAEKNKLFKLQSEGLDLLGAYLQGQGNAFFPRAIQLYDAALAIAMRIDDKKSMARSLHNLGFAYRLKGNYARALDYYNKGNIAANEARDTNQLMVNYHDLGWMRITMKNYEGSYSYLKKACELAAAKKDSFWIADNALHLGEAYWWANQLDSSALYSEKALLLFKNLNDTFHIIYALSQLGWVKESKMEWKEAEKLYRSAIKIWNDSSFIVGVAFSGLGDALYGQGRYKEAIPYYITAVKFLKSKYETPVWTRNNYESLAKTYAKLGDYPNAYAAFIHFKNESDSVLIHENSEKLNASQEEHDYDKLITDTKAEQDKKDATQQTELAKQRTQKYMLVAGAFVLLLTAIGLISRLRFARKSRLLLEEKNKLIIEEKEIAKAMQLRAEQSEKFRQQFLANMSHEIRTPMNAIMGMTELVLDSDLSLKQRSYLDSVKKSSGNLLHIINDILDLSKIEAGRIDLEKIDFSIREVGDQVKAMMKSKANEKNLQLIINIEPDVPEILVGDPMRLTQVLINLVGNAIKFTEKGSVALVIALPNGNGTDHPGISTVSFSIEDTGIGIPREKLNSIFESFSQAHSSDSRKYGGTGLGLTISRQFIELMGGELKVESEAGSGSTFSFVLHFLIGSKENLLKQNPSDEIDGSILDGLKILLVDDNSDNRIVARDLLMAKCKTDITEVNNGAEAIDLLGKKHFDVVLMDVQMPVMDGYTATQAIRKSKSDPARHHADVLDPDIPVIALTASVIRSELDKCRSAGMNDYIPKPFTISQIISTIAKHTNREIKFKSKDGLKSEHFLQLEDQAVRASSFNLSYLREFCEGNSLKMEKYIHLFLESAPLFIDSVNTALAKDDLTEIGLLVHGFKTKLVMMGMEKTKDLGEIIEMKCRKNTPERESVSAEANVMVDDVRQVMAELKRQFA